MLTKKDKIDRILIINPFGIGDVLFTTPLIKAIKENFPQSFIAYLCNKRTEPILANNQYVDEVFVFDKDGFRALWRLSHVKCIKKFISFLQKIKRKKIDLSIDLSLGRHYSFFLWLLGVPKRVGFDYKNRGRFLTKKIKIGGYDSKHIVEYYLELLNFLGLVSHDNKLDFSFPDSDKDWAIEFLLNNGVSNDDLLIGIVPGGGTSWGSNSSIRRWPIDKFAHVADALIKKYNAKIIFLGDTNDYSLCKNGTKLMEHAAINACGKTTLTQFAALLSRCNLVIANDGGPLHVAVAVNTKTVSIFGPVDERVYGPYPASLNHVVIRKDLSCRPCYKNFKMSSCQTRNCINLITVEEVGEATERLL